MADDTKLILVLSEHIVFGWMFHASRVLCTGDGEYELSGVAGVREGKERGSSSVTIDLLTILDGITDQALMRDFSKQKSLLVFLREIKQDIKDRFIRPRIERANLRAVEIAGKNDIPVFLRKDQASHLLYESDRLDIAPMPAECLFNFVKDGNGFRYFISLTCEGREISLRKKPSVILSDKPCVILTGKKIRMVENIEAKKLTPFFGKSHIDIPSHTETLYLKNFVFKTMLSYKVKIVGIPVVEVTPVKKAFLSLERDFRQRITLIPSFRYEDTPHVYPGSSKRKIAELEETSGVAVIRRYSRDMEWEDRLINLLKAEGLHTEDDRRFYTEGGEYGMIEWLNQREDGVLSDFFIENRLERRFFIDTVMVRPDFEMKIDWFELNIEVLAGEYRLPFYCFTDYILTKRKEYLLPDGTVLILPEEWFEKYSDLLSYCKEKNGTLRLDKRYASLLYHALNKDVAEKKQQLIRDILHIPVERPPLPNLQATLREYQKEGFYWLVHLYKHRLGGCLSDDMGLGKTLQAIALLQHIYAGDAGRSRPASLIVAPTSLLHNWRNELARFAPGLSVLSYSGEQRLRSSAPEDVERAFRPYRAIITSYGLMRNDIEYLREYTFNVVILDESQYIKNPSSQAYRATLQLGSIHRMALTGTPLENSLEDLWAQFNFIQDGLLGDLPSFRKDFIQPILRENDEDRKVLLKTLIGPFLLRRTKEEVMPELPPLVQETIFCDMTESQQVAYEKEKNSIRNIIMEAKGNAELKRNNFVALQWLSKLRQLANHPKLADLAYDGSSGKFEQILLSFETLKDSRHKTLIFSSYVTYLNLLAARFDAEGWKYAMLTGATLKREEEIRQFNEDENVFCFFISIKAGSTGLNLTAADYIFILDPWWNPAAEMQAMSRAHRIGQDKSVIAYRFISTDTVEEKIQHLQATKSVLYETFINSNNPLSQFTQAEVEELLM
jgi:superfamily II DNA or RNA helicase